MKNIEEKLLKSRPSVSIIILSLNEAGNIRQAIELVTESVIKQNLTDYEIIAVDGGSTDGTREIIKELVLKNNHIKAVYNYGKRGLGHDFKSGLVHASKEYVGWFPGDNETLVETIVAIFEQIGKADIIIPHTVNPQVRSLYRRLLSTAYTSIFNSIFGLRLKYFNGPCFFKRDLLKTITMTTGGPAYMAEILIQLIKGGASYSEIPMKIKVRDYGKTSVLKWKNVYLIAQTIIRLFFRLHFSRNKPLMPKGGINVG